MIELNVTRWKHVLFHNVHENCEIESVPHQIFFYIQGYVTDYISVDEILKNTFMKNNKFSISKKQ